MSTTYSNSDRHYRRLDILRADEQKFQVVVEESDIWVTISRDFPLAAARDAALRVLREKRGELKVWAEIHPEFQHSLTPLPHEADPVMAPLIIRRMDHSSRKMSVGPFAAVAGAVAQAVADELAALLTAHGLLPEVMVENGGDTYLHSCRERVVGLLPDPCSKEIIGLRFRPEDFPVSLCASSATIGHSLSFGQGDLALVRSRDGALADAAATAYGNMLKHADYVPRVLKQAEKDAEFGIEGVFVQCRGRIGLWGKLELTPVG